MDVLVLEPLGRDSDSNQCHTLPVTGSGQPVWSYKVIHSLWLPLLGLGVHRNDQGVHQGQLYQHRAQGQVIKNPKILLCLPLPASYLSGSVTERVSGNT